MDNNFLVKDAFEKSYNNSISTYSIAGIAFGSLFPLTANLFEFIRLGYLINYKNLKKIHKNNPVLFMIDTAPFFLGAFAYVAGLKQKKALELSKSQYKLLTIDKETEMYNKFSSLVLVKSIFKNPPSKEGFLSIAVINITNNKKIVSLMGVDFGSNFIKTVASVLKQLVDKDNIFRINEQEFMIIHYGEKIDTLIQKISTTFKQPINVLNIRCLAELNIGVSYCKNLESSCSAIINNAYTAMEKHKKLKHEPYIVFDQTMKPLSNHIEQESALFYALKRNEFFLLYQPIIDVKTKKIKGMEALIRWNSKKFGVISPAFFIPILEKTNLIIDVGFWIIREACTQTKYIQDNYDKDFFISINVSVSQMFDENFISSINNIIEDVGINKDTVRLEITESISFEKREFVRNKILLLDDNKYRLSIDDFGTGYSSLAELESMPLYSLKVDKSFIDKINEENADSFTPIPEMIVNMAHKMNMKVVMEGVETKYQYDFLKTINPDYIQGYYFYKPLSMTEIETIIKNSRA